MSGGKEIPIVDDGSDIVPGCITLTIKDKIDAEYKLACACYSTTLAEIAAARESVSQYQGCQISIRIPRYAVDISDEDEDAPSDPSAVEIYGERVIGEYILFTVTHVNKTLYKVRAGGEDINIKSPSLQQPLFAV